MVLNDEGLRLALRDVVSSGFPELQGWDVEASFGYTGNKFAYARVIKTHSMRFVRIILNRRLRNLSQEAVSAIIAHELAHITLRERGSADEDEAASKEAIRKGFISCFRKLFADICKRPYCKTRRKGPAFPFIVEGRRLIVAGLRCEEFCPYALT